MAEIVVEYSRSARAACRACKLKIPKDVVRVGRVTEVSFGGGTKWVHLDCWRVPKNFEEFDDGYDRLRDEDKARVDAYVADTANQTKTFRTARAAAAAAAPPVEVTPEMLLDKRKVAVATDTLKHFKNPSLKNMLRENEQKIGGRKAELLERVSDGVLFGRLPQCPKCGGGKLTLTGIRQFQCKGFFDDDHFVRCSLKYNEYAPLPEDDESHVTRGEWTDVEGEVAEVNAAIAEMDDDPASGSASASPVASPPKRKRKKPKSVPRRRKKKAATPPPPSASASESDSDSEDDIMDSPPVVLRGRRRSSRRRTKVSYADEESESEEEEARGVTGKKRRRKAADSDDEFEPTRKRRKR